MSRIKFLPLAFLALLLSLPASAAPPADWNAPRGRFAELHSCEVFAGPCVVNSEVTQDLTYALRVWQFDQGSLNGQPLSGLTVALLEKSHENLADSGKACDAVLYLPPGLSAAQRAALVLWAQQNTAARLDATHIQVAPLQIDFAAQRVRFSAGASLTFGGDIAPPCTDGRSCGEMLWYQPRIAATSFVVDQLGQSNIIEPLLSLHWMDHGRRTLFVGRFGDPEVTVPALCGAQTTSL